MDIFGIDFTSSPSKRKPITCAGCRLAGSTLHLETTEVMEGFGAFEGFLAHPGPWVAGMDFPFGQPRKLIENIGWPASWEGYVRHIGQMSKGEFVEVLRLYRSRRPSGDKQHLRLTDMLAGSRSPMMVFGVPVGKMFFEGAPRLLQSGADIIPCRRNADPRRVVEAYPALVARRWAGGGYKSDSSSQQSEARRNARLEIIRGLLSEAEQHFGLRIEVSKTWVEAAVADATGDQLDAMLCAVQAAWAYVQRDATWGIPPGADRLEGWIVDPMLAGGRHPLQ